MTMDQHTSCYSGINVEYRDLEAAETLISMSFWCQRSNQHKLHPLTFTGASCDSHEPLPEETPDTTKELVALPSLVRPHTHKQLTTLARVIHVFQSVFFARH